MVIHAFPQGTQQMPAIPPPPRQLALSLIIEKLHLKVPQWVGFVVLAVALPSGVWMALADSRGGPPLGPVPAPIPQVPLLASAPTALPVLAMVLPGSLPPPGPNQLRAGKCDERGSEVAINGGCWLATDKKPPCPEGIQWEHEGRCWRPVAPAARAPTTGEPHTAPVAAPED